VALWQKEEEESTEGYDDGCRNADEVGHVLWTWERRMREQ